MALSSLKRRTRSYHRMHTDKQCKVWLYTISQNVGLVALLICISPNVLLCMLDCNHITVTSVQFIVHSHENGSTSFAKNWKIKLHKKFLSYIFYYYTYPNFWINKSHEHHYSYIFTPSGLSWRCLFQIFCMYITLSDLSLMINVVFQTKYCHPNWLVLT